MVYAGAILSLLAQRIAFLVGLRSMVGYPFDLLDASNLYKV